MYTQHDSMASMTTACDNSNRETDRQIVRDGEMDTDGSGAHARRAGTDGRQTDSTATIRQQETTDINKYLQQ